MTNVLTHSSFVIRHSQILPPIVFIRSAKNQLNLLGPIVCGPQESLDCRLNLQATRISSNGAARPVQPIECRSHFKNLGSNRQKLLIEDLG